MRHHDSRPGLFNRAVLQQRLHAAVEHAGQASAPVAVLLLDLDRYNDVYEAFGLRGGDLLLLDIGNRLKEVVRSTDTLARFGSVDFAIVMRGIDVAGAELLADRIMSALEQPFEIDGAHIEIGASIGIACFPSHAQNAEGLLRNAESALSMAKDDRSGWTTYAPEHDHHAPDRLALITDLRRAIEKNELLLYYQPQVDVRSGALTGVEALVRWNHPRLGLLAPSAFIPLAEQTRLIGRVTRWAVQAALQQATVWNTSPLSVPVAVNISAHDLQSSGFPGQIADLLEQSGVAPERLRLEITEGSLLADPRRARESVFKLRALGVGLAIDDFGTGYSSMSYLQRLPVDELKIDRTFVAEMATEDGARAIVRAVIDLADDLGLRVIAEGVEDPATWELLAALGCDNVQGYFFSPPLSADDLVATWSESTVPRGLDEAGIERVDAALHERIRGRRKRLIAEEEFIARKRAEHALRESEQRLRLAIEAAGVATWDWDLVADRVTWSGGDSTLFGVPPGDIDGSSELFLARVHPDDRTLFRDAIAEAIAGSGELRVEHRIVRSTGVVRWATCKGRVLRDLGGRPVRLLGTNADITQRKEAERQREHLIETEKLRALGQMASGIAHELTQSLLLITGNGELAEHALAEPSADLTFARDALQTIALAAMKGGDIVKRLLTFASSHPNAEAEQVDIGQLVDDVAQLTASRWRDGAQNEGRPISMLVEADSDLQITGWSEGLQEALTALVLNAVDALPSGGDIRLSAHRVANHVEIEVADSGVGMTAEIRAHILEPFFTTKGQHAAGLGLAQVFGIVERHQGRLEVDSAPGSGTSIRLILPTTLQCEAQVRRLDAATGVRGTRPLRILTVDDEPLIGKMMARILRADQHVVATATSGEEALERLGADTFDLVITDIGMGSGMNGWELVEHVRRRWPRLTLVLATGWGAQIDPLQARLKGVEAVLAKPFRPEELKEVLGRIAPRLEAA